MITSETGPLFQELFARTEDDAAAPLDVRDLRVQFGGLAAVKDVSFTLANHEIMSIVGQNGAGKSTVLNSISGLVQATPSSRILVRGRNINGRSAWRRGRSGLGRAFQDPPLVDEMSLRDNLLVGAHAAEGSSPIDRVIRPARARAEEESSRERAEMLLDVIGLADRADIDAGSLPYGGRKLLDIARGLMCRPDVLLLDEPTSGLDASEQSLVKQLLQAIGQAGFLSILMVEHHMDLVRSVSGRVLVLEAGSILTIAPPDEALAGVSVPDTPSGASTTRTEKRR